MQVEGPLNCKNCGAVLADSTDNKIKCIYCGTIYRENAQATSNRDIDTNEVAITRKPVEPSQANDKNSAAAGIFGIVALGFVLFIIVCIANNSGHGTISHNDSVTTDTLQLHFQSLPSQLSDSEENDLKTLAGLKIGHSQFSKLYKDSCVVTRDIAIQENYVKDKSSLAGKPLSGLYAYVSYNDIAYSINFGSQQISKKTSKLQSLTFIIKGKRIHYTPSFTTDSLQHQIIEYSDDIIYGDQVSMLLKLATADNVIIRFNGDKTHRQIVLAKDQQDVLKRQLKLYKGFLLGYAKQ